jgi:TP901 family phage tail tape measure protein
MALNRISTEIIEVRLDAGDASQDLEAIEKRLEEVEKKVRGVDNATEKAGGGFSKLQAGITTAGAALAGLQAAAAAASAAIEAIKAPVSLAANFETQFAQVRTLNHEIGEDLKQQLLTLAKEVPQTAGDLTSAAYQAISAGIQPTDLMGFLTAASQTAVAAGGSLTEAVELLTAGVNSFGRQGETAASISNKLFATVRAGVTTIPELNAVFGRATAAASSYGVSVEEVLGAIAVLTKSGLPTSEAVTRVNATLKELSSESGTAAKALKEQGVQLGVTALKQKGFVGVLEEVNEATRGQAAEIARLSGRQEAVQGILKLTGENMTAFSSTVKTIRNDTTAAADANAILANTTNNLNAQFEAAREGAIRELGMTILPAFNELLIAMTEEIGNSGGAIEILGGAMELAVKAITAFVKSAKTIAITMAAAFGVRYAPLFLAQLAQMRAGLVAFRWVR